MVSSFHFVFRERDGKKIIFTKIFVKLIFHKNWREKKIYFFWRERKKIIGKKKFFVLICLQRGTKFQNVCGFFSKMKINNTGRGSFFLMNGFSIMSRQTRFVFFFQGCMGKKEPAWWNFVIFVFLVVVLVCFRGCFFMVFLSSKFLITWHISASIPLPNQYTFLCQFWIFLQFPVPMDHPDLDHKVRSK